MKNAWYSELRDYSGWSMQCFVLLLEISCTLYCTINKNIYCPQTLRKSFLCQNEIFKSKTNQQKVLLVGQENIVLIIFLQFQLSFVKKICVKSVSRKSLSLPTGEVHWFIFQIIPRVILWFNICVVCLHITKPALYSNMTVCRDYELELLNDGTRYLCIQRSTF